MGKIARKLTWGRVATLVLLAIAAYIIFQQQRQIFSLYQYSLALQSESVALRSEIIQTQTIVAEQYVLKEEVQLFLQRQEAINTILAQYIDQLLKEKALEKIPEKQPNHQERETETPREDKRQKYNRQQRNGTRQEIV